MAVAPLYVADVATLKEELRLSAIGTTDDAQRILERCMIAARAKIYARLGASAANSWVAIAYSENPTTEQGVLRSIANVLEVSLVFVHLLDALPIFFMDDSGGTQHTWNEEGAFRGMDVDERAAMRKSLLEQIEEYFELLSGADVLGDDASFQAHVGSPVNPPKLGGSTFYQPDATDFDGNFRRTGLNPEN